MRGLQAPHANEKKKRIDAPPSSDACCDILCTPGYTKVYSVYRLSAHTATIIHKLIRVGPAQLNAPRVLQAYNAYVACIFFSSSSSLSTICNARKQFIFDLVFCYNFLQAIDFQSRARVLHSSGGPSSAEYVCMFFYFIIIVYFIFCFIVTLLTRFLLIFAAWIMTTNMVRWPGPMRGESLGIMLPD